MIFFYLKDEITFLFFRQENMFLCFMSLIKKMFIFYVNSGGYRLKEILSSDELIFLASNLFR